MATGASSTRSPPRPRSSSTSSRPSDRAAGPARGEARRDPAGRPRQGLLHARRRRGDRERDQARPRVHGPPQDPRPLPRRTTARPRGDDAHRRPAPLGQRAGPRRRRPLSRYPPLGRGRVAPAAEALQGLEDVIRYEGPQTIAAVFLETIVGTNGILIPPDGYIQGVREICDRYDILMVADEVMAGFGRTGRWFAIEHWDTVPDLMTMAKGLTSSYLPLGAVAMNHRIADHFETILLRRADVLVARRLVRGGPREHRRLRGGRADRELRPPRAGHAPPPRELYGEASVRRVGPEPRPVRDPRPRPARDPWTPMTPFNGTSDEMKAVGKYLRENGLYTMIATTRSTQTRRSASPRSSSPRASRSSTGPGDRRPGGRAASPWRP